MNARSTLLAQIDSLVNSIDEAMSRLKPSQVDSRLLERVQARFQGDLNRELKQVVSLRDRVRLIPADASLEISWGAYEHLRSQTEAVLSECLAFIEGALARSHKIDGGVCRLTDSMLYELSRRTDIGWDRFTILAEGEFFAGLSGIIRIRFSDVTIWNLPVSAHELGHFVAATWKDPTLADLIGREKRKDTRYEAYLKEHFADLFATYSMGPCFPLACGLSRFSPVHAFQENATHPAEAQRMWWILETLRSIDQLRRGGPPLYTNVVDQIEKSWTASLSAAGQVAAIDSSDTVRLRSWLAELLDAMDTNLSVARYGGWLRAQDMAESLRDRKAPNLAENDRIPDVLNAAWLCRSEAEPPDGFYVTWLENNACKLCGQLAGKQP
jgi:hypothetical protein